MYITFYYMKSEEYPNNVVLAQAISKLVWAKVEPDILRIQDKLRDNATIQIVTGLSCTVKYQQPAEKSGKVTVTLTPKKWDEIKSEKEFDTTMDERDIGDVTGHFHVLPIHAFKSAVHEIINKK